ncbi:septin and tuftelin-interacting protein 1 homolog [Spodoptera frugiperda]|uniref:Septin and tuftelin-interacting protein 1 homolog n=1 Tax=Spodoptera frugiperda TaxID=7108 RepID=A0A9R0ER54_SPOFR|nr:septin and tuftelin-interacting protein 1 homolog [Spodoptera frugiperda]
MRSSRRSKNNEKPYDYHRINKKRYKKKSRFGWGRNDGISSGPFLENLNEVLREKKYHRGEGKGNWKVMPRDSCEIYKARQKRMESSRRKYNNEDTDNMSDDDDDDRRGRKKQRKKTSKKPPKSFRPRGPRGKNKKRNAPKSRVTHQSSDTSSSFTRTSYTYTTVSDMDY